MRRFPKRHANRSACLPTSTTSRSGLRCARWMAASQKRRQTGSTTSSTQSYTREQRAISAPSPLKRRLARVDAIFEIREILPCGIRRFMAGSRHVDRRSDQLHARYVTRTVRKDGPCSDAHNELRAHCLTQQRVLVTHRCLAVDAKPLRLAVHGDEQHTNAGIDQNIAQTLEHAVPIVIR